VSLSDRLFLGFISLTGLVPHKGSLRDGTTRFEALAATNASMQAAMSRAAAEQAAAQRAQSGQLQVRRPVSIRSVSVVWAF
jgi:hypothetical protein